MVKNDPEMLAQLAQKNQELDSEYGKLMAELGGGAPQPQMQMQQGIQPTVSYRESSSLT